MADLKKLAEAVISGKQDETKKMTDEAIAEGVVPKTILDEGLIAGMNEVGRRFKGGEFYVPEVLIAARAMHSGMDLLKPKLIETGVKPVATFTIATVKGDLHDIGKNLVSMMLQGAGFEVNDLGVDAPAEKFVQAAKEGSEFIGLSALLTTTMPSMKEVIEELKKAGVRDKVKVLVGGAPLTQEYADEIGADGYAPDAASGVDVAKSLM